MIPVHIVTGYAPCHPLMSSLFTYPCRAKMAEQFQALVLLERWKCSLDHSIGLSDLLAYAGPPARLFARFPNKEINTNFVDV